MLEREGLPSFYNRGETAVLACGDKFARLELDGRTAVGAPDFLSHSH